MSWRINLVKNDVVIDMKTGEALLKCGVECDYGWEHISDVFNNGKLNFNYDHMEHMDFLEYKDVQKVLKKHKVSGEVCFASHEGDNEGKTWGYRFDGKGGMTKLKGTTTFEPAKKSKKGVPTKKTRKTSKKAPKSKKAWACTACFNDKALPEEDQFGIARGRDVRKEHKDVTRYCGTCGNDYNIERV